MPEHAETRAGYYLVAKGASAAMNSVVLYTCITCGSLVESVAVPRHDAWHAHIDGQDAP